MKLGIIRIVAQQNVVCYYVLGVFSALTVFGKER